MAESARKKRETTLQDVLLYLSYDASLEDIDAIYKEANERKRRLGDAIRKNCKVGSKVSFFVNRGRHYGLHKGTIAEIKKSRAIVDVNGTFWRVPFTLLQTGHGKEE